MDVMRGGGAVGAMAGVGLGNGSVLELIWTAGGDATVIAEFYPQTLNPGNENAAA